VALVPGDDVMVQLDASRWPDEHDAYWATAEAQLADHPGFSVRAEIRSREGRTEVIEVSLRKELPRAHFTAPGSVTTRMLRDIPLGTIQQRAYGALRAAERRGDLEKGSTDQFRDVHRPGRRGRDSYEYALLAAEYVDWCDRSRTPVRDMATAKGIPSQRLSNALYVARSRGLLTRQGQGTSGGRLTAKAQRILSERSH
jgi:hypothetical protein